MSQSNTTIRNQFRWAYRAARVERQINWTPDYADPDDIDPKKFAPGGDYYNSPELCAHYKSTRMWEDGYQGPRYGLELDSLARRCVAQRGLPGISEQHAARWTEFKADRDWQRMWGDERLALGCVPEVTIDVQSALKGL